MPIHTKMHFTFNINNNNYYNSGNRSSWSRRMKPNGGNGPNKSNRSTNRPGINRLGGKTK
tara:strand:- start:178 stop:357 length:180 start_codon:yes stop_codon:yes gene_type:complete